ncbi:MAG: hypothetical protein V3U73_15310, partial [bacterium]
CPALSRRNRVAIGYAAFSGLSSGPTGPRSGWWAAGGKERCVQALGSARCPRCLPVNGRL